MTTIPKKTLPGCGRTDGTPSTLPDDRNSAQSLRPTFDGWGPRL
ncbi:MAG TPA: hypothetical protein VHR97_06495 [Candidatus Baltobacteraceae bacterium]|jgi:hypothetical protein|nr:hypothetical protein [Candidatus Baltobacteraceae bacterium]